MNPQWSSSISLHCWNILNKKELLDINIKSYLIGIANNKIKKHYTLLQRLKTVSIFEANDKDIESNMEDSSQTSDNLQESNI